MNTPTPALWAQELLTHLDPADPSTRFTQLATITPEGRPQVRTMVIREVRPESGQLLFNTDNRTEKAQQLLVNPQAELCWYFVKPWLQFRLQGTIELHGPDSTIEDVHQAWANISPNMRQSFFWGAPRSPKTQYPPTPPSDLSTPAEHFRIGVLTVTHVIRLDLQTQPHTRTQYTRAPKGWMTTDIW
ncbi:MAG: pyridoxamine 5'-phosphate oxidase family protein [Bradymonadia bacterium]